MKKKGHPIDEPFSAIRRSVMYSERYRQLGSFDRDLMWYMESLRNPKRDDGNVWMGSRKAAEFWYVGKSTAHRSLQRLEREGWITCVRRGHYVPGEKGDSVSSLWKLNFLTPDFLKELRQR
jgi:hypothetical protein